MFNPFEKSQIEAIYRKHLFTIVSKIKVHYHELGLMASGDFEKELQILINGNKLSILGAKHTYFMEEGRKAGRFPPINSIINWIEVKSGLPAIFKEKPKQYAFLIARNIANEGIKVPNKYNKGRVASLIIDEFLEKDLEIMLKEIGVSIAERIQSDLIQVFKIAS